jgi:serine/threonine-protein kinase HipA
VCGLTGGRERRRAPGRLLLPSPPFTPGNAPHRGDKIRACLENLLPDSKDSRERMRSR